MSGKALIFDCDGVLADTERDGHRVAFNSMFQELGLPFEWDEVTYGELVKIGGGKERLATLLTPKILIDLGLTDPAAAIADWHRRKTEIYSELINSGQIPPRPGVRRLIVEALESGWQVAVASTSALPSVTAVLRNAIGDLLADRVSVYAGDIVVHKKPAPDIYQHALKDLGVTANGAVVVEDSGIGCRAAVAAGLPTVITVSGYTASDKFDGAALILSDLGEVQAPARLIANPTDLPFAGLVDLTLLQQLRH